MQQSLNSETLQTEPTPRRHIFHVRGKLRNKSIELPEINKIRHNKNLSASSHDHKLARIREQAKEREIRITVAQMAKTVITAERKQFRKERFIEKFRKHKIRTNRGDYQHLKRNLLTLYFFLGASYVLYKKTQNRKRLHQRAYHSLKWIYEVFKCGGRIILIAKANRKKRAMTIFRIHLRWRIHKWVKEIRGTKRETITDLVEHALTSDIMFSMMVRFRRKLVLVQTSLSDMIRAKARFYDDVLDNWNLTEQSSSKKEGSKTSDLVKKLTKRATVLGTSTIPEDVKILYVREFIRSYIKTYHLACCEYYRRLHQLKSLAIEEQMKQGLLNEKYRLIKPPRPMVPSSKLLLLGEPLKELIRKAMSERNEWPSKLNVYEKKIRLSHK